MATVISQRALRFGLIGAALAAAAIYFCTYTVDEREQALVLAFGEPREVVKDPGLHFKLPPPFNNVLYFEDRILRLETPSREVISRDQRRLVVDSFALWRITDPLKFYQSVRTIGTAEQRISANLNTALLRVLSGQNFAALLTADRATTMNQIRNEARDSSAAFGVDIIDVRIRRADLPDANLVATYNRMNTERQREAADFRAKGQEAAQITRAEADRQALELVSNARRDAEYIRGEADAARNGILADAFGGDPEFYGFYRHMLAYERVFGEGSAGTSAVLTPESNPFLRYFQDMAGGSERITALPALPDIPGGYVAPSFPRGPVIEPPVIEGVTPAPATQTETEAGTETGTPGFNGSLLEPAPAASEVEAAPAAPFAPLLEPAPAPAAPQENGEEEAAPAPL
ncbi:protease modulator HflC [Neomegalonema perideroedes]|uniref:protease modulator HflC n=1 Tax=Neomegalonema perideroedes TaxID=217219 RepID=UPI000378F329|nr:protease modulator HflC [Neomegalonema perideroedes]